MQLSLHSKKTIILIIAFITWIVWLTFLGIDKAFFHLIHYWQIALTMLFGSMIAGGTSIGGGAVAFPVFTKLLHIPPHDAKIFSLAIQSVGMVAAALTIYLTKITVEWRVIPWASFGGIIGIFLGLNYFSSWLAPDILKMCFTVMLTSFSVTLFILNKNHKRKKKLISNWGNSEKWACVLAGIIGGIMSGLAGNGIDIVVFSVMVLVWRLSEKVATPTSVILMAINAVVGFFLQVSVFDDFPTNVQHYWLAAIPIVVIGAPLGTVLCSKLNHSTIANCLIFLILIEMVSSFLIIPLRPVIILSSVLSMLLFSGLNYWLYRLPLLTLSRTKN
ncbi:MAG: sulfite exporter TauE/SafE family protein [Crocosphaera sp.]|nr:sulfite exporter TauE/SafE family protein [Crocosphaera sp.]